MGSGAVVRGLSYEEVQRRLAAVEALRRVNNAEKIQSVAASLPRLRLVAVDGALTSTNPQELATPGGSTTTTLSGGSRGCEPHGND